MIETATEEAVGRALSEDMVEDDVTTRWSVAADAIGPADVIAREPGVVAGLAVMTEVYRRVDPSIQLVDSRRRRRGIIVRDAIWPGFTGRLDRS